MLCLLLGVAGAVRVSTDASAGCCRLGWRLVGSLGVVPVSIVARFAWALFCFIYFQLIRWLPTEHLKKDEELKVNYLLQLWV